MTRTALIVLLVVLVESFVSPAKVMAAVSCTANVSPNEIYPGEVEPTFFFTLTNSGNENIVWFQIQSPNSQIEPWSVSAQGWDISSEGDTSTFRLRTILPGATVSPQIQVQQILESLASFSGNWVVRVSANADGSGNMECGGNLGLTVTASAPDNTGPVLSNVTLTDLGSSSVTVNWETNEMATSVVEYDVNQYADPFTFSKASETLTTSHSQTLTQSLAPETTYYYRICSTDGSSNQTCSEPLAFTTTAAAAPVQETVVVTQTVTQTVTNTVTNTVVAPTPTPVPKDLTPPGIKFTNEWQDFYKNGPVISGNATDNKAVIRAEYTVNGGLTWQGILIEPATKVEFEIQLPIEDEGNYEVNIRAKDAEGNMSLATPKKIVIDRIPPRLGAYQLEWGKGLPLPRCMNEGESVKTIVGQPIAITLGMVGGPTEITWKFGNQQTDLIKDGVSGLWIGKLIPSEVGKKILTLSAVDGANRTMEESLCAVEVVPAPTLMGEAKLSVYVKDEISGRLTLFDGQAYGLNLPMTVKDVYSLILPKGTYSIKLTAAKMQAQESYVFTLAQPTLIVNKFELVECKKWQLWGINLPFGWCWPKLIATEYLEQPKNSQYRANIGEQLANINLRLVSGNGDTISIPDEFRGESMVVIAPFWQHDLADMGEELADFKRKNPDKKVLMIIDQGTIESLLGNSWVDRLGANLVAVDGDGEVMRFLKRHDLPLVLHLNAAGTILEEGDKINEKGVDNR